MHFTSVFVAFVVFLISTNSYAGHLSDVLKRMSEADQKQNYQGTFILRKSDKLSTLRVTHGSDEKGVWESLEALNGEPRKIVRRNNKVVSIYPDRKLVTIRTDATKQPLHRQLPANINQLEHFYSINMLPEDRIAKHPAFVVDLVPIDKLRYGYRYWIDKNTGMLLRCDLLAENNTVVEQMMFTSLDYLAQAPAPAFDLKQFEHYRQLLLAAPEVADADHDTAPQWAVKTLPEGFMLRQTMRRYSQPSTAQNSAGKNSPPPDMLHLVYSDGLASVSVFIEKNMAAAKHLRGSVAMGAVNAFGLPVGDYFVTVVGEVPVKTVRSMAQSVEKLQ